MSWTIDSTHSTIQTARTARSRQHAQHDPDRVHASQRIENEAKTQQATLGWPGSKLGWPGSKLGWWCARCLAASEKGSSRNACCTCRSCGWHGHGQSQGRGRYTDRLHLQPRGGVFAGDDGQQLSSQQQRVPRTRIQWICTERHRAMHWAPVNRSPPRIATTTHPPLQCIGEEGEGAPQERERYQCGMQNQTLRR